MKNSIQLCDKYNQVFKTIVADTTTLQEEVFKIRFNVYCEELKFETPLTFPDQMEKDSYDKRSIHCLVQHKQSGEYAGCVRIILCNPDNPIEGFPCEKILQKGEINNLLEIDRFRYCEVSRLAVKAKFRKKIEVLSDINDALFFEESQYQDHSTSRDQLPLVALGLYMISNSIGAILNLKLLSIMEARLARHLNRCGIPSHQIGSFVEYNGIRAAFLMDPEDISQNLPPETLGLFKAIRYQLHRSVYILDYKNILEKMEHQICA